MPWPYCIGYIRALALLYRVYTCPGPSSQTVFFVVFLQRPNAKELLKQRFIRNAKKNSCLQDLIERYKRWKANGGDSGDELSDTESRYVYMSCDMYVAP